MRSVVAPLAVLTAVVLGACGGAKEAPPASPGGSATAADAGPETFAEVKAEDLAALGAGGPAAPAASSSAPPPTSDEPEDTCTPAGVAYEKAVRPKLKACYREAKAKAPNLEGAARFVLEIDTLGKAKPVKVVEKSLPEPLMACMLKAFKATPFDEAKKCPGKTITIPIAFPTPP